MGSPILEANNFEDFISIPFKGEMNALCWKRELRGDFLEIVQKIESTDTITVIEPEDLLKLQLSAEGQLARETILDDLNSLEEKGASPVLNLIKEYDKDESYPFFPTDVYSFHVDRSPIPTATILCTYFGASSEILPNAQAEQKIHLPEIRAELRKLHTGSEDEFEEFLKEYFFDLHYQAKPNSKLISLGQCHLWRLAVDYPDSPSLACIHRAPKENPGEPRLMLIC